MTLGCPGGRSLRTTYNALARIAAERANDLSALHIVMMDEYVEARGEHWALCSPDAHYSCYRFGDEEIRRSINAGLPDALRIPANNLHVPDPNAPLRYESLIERLGGVDVFLLASGASDGHVAFNPQGCAFGERTRIVELAEATRTDNLATFPEFRDLSEVPRFGVSVGPATIASHSQAAILVLLGDAKTPRCDASQPPRVTTRIGPPASYSSAPIHSRRRCRGRRAKSRLSVVVAGGLTIRLRTSRDLRVSQALRVC